MFKIMVDGIENSRHSPTCAAVTVGSAADAQVRLPSAAPEHIKIYPLHGSYGGCFKVTVHAADGMTHKFRTIAGERQTVQWTTDHGDWLVGTDINRWGGIGDKKVFIHGHERPGWVLVHGGDFMTIKAHTIQVINYCGTCGKQGNALWQCTCAERAT